MAANEALKSLHTSLIDTQRGYDEAIKDAQAPAMAVFFEKMAALHRRAHEDVDSILLERGERPDEFGLLYVDSSQSRHFGAFRDYRARSLVSGFIRGRRETHSRRLRRSDPRELR